MDVSISPDIERKLSNLFSWLKSKACVVAFSGGVDSSTLAKALVLAWEKGLLPNAPIAYLAESDTSTALELSEGRRIANEIGIELRVVKSTEFDEPKFVENSPLRCYWCKKVRFAALKELAQKEVGAPCDREIVLLDGTNADDFSDYRPGMQASKEVGVSSPLAIAGLTKSDIRTLARYWTLSVADKPSTPCLASRIAYGVAIEPEVLRRVEKAEQLIKDLGASICRARVDAPRRIRIEVPEKEIELFVKEETRLQLVNELRALGFNYVSLDLEGFCSGKNNRDLS